MKLPRLLLIAAVLLLVQTVTADAAAIIRTAPFNGIDVDSGFARCAVTNASTRTGVASAILYDSNGTEQASFSSISVGPHATFPTDPVDLQFFFVTHCECTVPNSTLWRCTVLYSTSGQDSGTAITAP